VAIPEDDRQPALALDVDLVRSSAVGKRHPACLSDRLMGSQQAHRLVASRCKGYLEPWVA
jgi:hypothetical protein